MCLLLTLLLFGPRAAIVVYWLGWPSRWESAFDTFIVPFVGFLLLPWTTLLYVGLAPDGVEGFEYALLAFGFLLDAASLLGGAGYRRADVPSSDYSGPTSP